MYGEERDGVYLTGMTEETTAQTRVLYNDNCPVCSFEINHYAAYSAREALPIRFDDLNDGQARAAWNIDADTAARRLYVLDEGVLLSGIPAFIVLWEKMPRYRWLAKLVSVPGIYHVASVLYDYVLAPVIYRWHLRRIRRAQG
jgi:predicted DCC family thiol-disulfide oxidoreductase YuxK